MGGYGSGIRTSKKGTSVGYISFSIDKFRRRGQWRYLSGTLTWWRGNVKRASLGYIIRNEGITLYWQNRNGESVHQHLLVTKVNVNYGARYFFLCPACNKRVAKLYAGSRFYCRHCYNITYESCQKSHSSWPARLGLTGKQYRNLMKAVEYSRALKERKWVGERMLRRLNTYIDKSNIRFET